MVGSNLLWRSSQRRAEEGGQSAAEGAKTLESGCNSVLYTAEFVVGNREVGLAHCAGCEFVWYAAAVLVVGNTAAAAAVAVADCKVERLVVTAASDLTVIWDRTGLPFVGCYGSSM